MDLVSSELPSFLAFAAISLAASLLVSGTLTFLPRPGILTSFSAFLTPALAAAATFHRHGAGAAIALLCASAVTMVLLGQAANILLHLKHPSPDKSATLTPSAAMLLPVTLSFVLAGSASRLTLAACIAFMILVVLTLNLLEDESRPHRPGRLLHGCLAILAATLPATMLIMAANHLLRAAPLALPQVQAQIILVNLLAPLVSLPSILVVVRMRSDDAFRGAAGFIGSGGTMILGLGLPAVAAAEAFLSRHDPFAPYAGIPPLTWRLDGGVLLAAGFSLAGMRLGFIPPSRWVAMLHLLLYGGYALVGTLLRQAMF